MLKISRIYTNEFNFVLTKLKILHCMVLDFIYKTQAVTCNERIKVTRVVFPFLLAHYAVLVYSEFTSQMLTYLILQSFGEMSYILREFQQL